MLGDGADDFRGKIVDVRFHAGDGIALIAVRGGRRDGLSQDGAQDIGAARQYAAADSVADFFDLHLRHRPEGLGEFGDNGGAGGSDEFERLIHRAEGDSGEDFEGGGRGDGEVSMGGINPAAALGQRRGDHAVDLEGLDADAGKDDIGDGIQRADLVKGHLVGFHAMDFSFGLRDPLEDADRVALYEFRKVARLDQAPDFPIPAAMVVMLVVLLRVRMVVLIVAVFMMVMFVAFVLVLVAFVFMPMALVLVVMMIMVLLVVAVMLVVKLLIILIVGMSGAFVNGEFYPLDILPHLPLPMGVEIADLEFAQFPLESGGFHPQVAQGADGHIATDAGETIEIEHTHGGHCSIAGRIFQALMPTDVGRRLPTGRIFLLKMPGTARMCCIPAEPPTELVGSRVWIAKQRKTSTPMKFSFKYKSLQPGILSLVAAAGVMMGLSTTSKALDNTNYGTGALQSGTTTGVYDSAFGFDALHANTTGAYNTAMGVNALLNITIGNYNTATGVNALAATVKGSYDTANGYQALRLDTTGTDNTAGGANALYNCTTDSEETAFGFEALYSDKVANVGPNQNVAVGYQALYSSTGGYFNEAIGVQALYSNTTGYYNTADGHQSLINNTTGFENTANGGQAMYNNTTGYQNVANGYLALYTNSNAYAETANGAFALYENTSGLANTATGWQALENNTTANNNTATGSQALTTSTSGYNNTADGAHALYFNTNGFENTGDGYEALYNNSEGYQNSAFGYDALYSNTNAYANTAVGTYALYGNTSGLGNIGLGWYAGSNLTTGDYNIDIGDLNPGTFASDDAAGESGTIRIGDTVGGAQSATYIAGIYNQSYNSNDSPLAVFIDSTGKLGTNPVAPSSRQFKKDIKPMGDASSVILSLKPVTFQYIKPEYDPRGGQEFGLIAEEVDKICPQLVARNPDGKIYGIRYDAVNAMLLNEFLKEHKRVEEQSQTEAALVKQVAAQGQAMAEQGRINAQQQQEIATLTASLKEQAALLQKVSAQLQLGKSEPQVVSNNN